MLQSVGNQPRGNRVSSVRTLIWRSLEAFIETVICMPRSHAHTKHPDHVIRREGLKFDPLKYMGSRPHDLRDSGDILLAHHR